MAKLYTGFNDQASSSSFPFVPGCSRADRDGRTLPAWFIAGLGISLPSGHTQAYLASAYISDRLWSASIAVDGEVALVVSVRTDALADTRGASVPMKPLMPGASGSIMFGTPNPGDTYALRYYYADASNTALLPTVVHASRSMPVSSLYSGVLGSSGARQLVGDLTISGGGDMVVDTDPANGNNIIFRLTGSREDYLSVCDKGSANSDTPISSINGVFPGQNGSLTIRLTAPQPVGV